MKRHLFIALIVCAVGSLPFPVHAQQPAIPVIGFLSSGSPDRYTIRLNAFQQGLKEAGYIESQNVTVEYRWAEGQNARLPTLAAELVHRQVAVLVAGGTPAALAAKAASYEHSDCFPGRDRSGRDRTCRKPQPAQQQLDGRDDIERGVRAEMARIPASNTTRREQRCRAH